MLLRLVVSMGLVGRAARGLRLVRPQRLAPLVRPLGALPSGDVAAAAAAAAAVFGGEEQRRGERASRHVCAVAPLRSR